MAELDEFQQRLGHTFTDGALLHLALTHPSLIHEQSSRAQTNQRLEFLGDAVLQLILTHDFYARFPSHDEGQLTKARAKLVNRDALAERGRALGLGTVILLGRGEEQCGGRDKNSLLADGFEALLGAIYLDGGFAAAREFVLREFAADIAEVTFDTGIENPKGELQELLQTTSTEPPRYEVTAAAGPDHERSFECRVLHAGHELARGSGGSKKTAEAHAALAALKNLRSQNENVPPVEK
jgi:ribonuclease-3